MRSEYLILYGGIFNALSYAGLSQPSYYLFDRNTNDSWLCWTGNSIVAAAAALIPALGLVTALNWRFRSEIDLKELGKFLIVNSLCAIIAKQASFLGGVPSQIQTEKEWTFCNIMSGVSGLVGGACLYLIKSLKENKIEARNLPATAVSITFASFYYLNFIFNERYTVSNCDSIRFHYSSTFFPQLITGTICTFMSTYYIAKNLNISHKDQEPLLQTQSMA